MYIFTKEMFFHYSYNFFGILIYLATLGIPQTTFHSKVGQFKVLSMREIWPFNWPFVKLQSGHFWPYFDPLQAI